MAGFVTPTQILLLVAILAVVVSLGRLARADARSAAEKGRGLRGALRGLRIARPTPRQLHITWLVASALLAFVLTRAVALPLFLLVFFAVWVCVYWVLVRRFR